MIIYITVVKGCEVLFVLKLIELKVMFCKKVEAITVILKIQKYKISELLISVGITF